MLLNDKKILFGLTSSQYAFNKTIPQISRLIKEGADVIPIMSFDAYNIDSKFGKAKEFIGKIEKITSKKVIHTNEILENKELFNEVDIMIIAPCSRKLYWKAGNRNNEHTSAKSNSNDFKE